MLRKFARKALGLARSLLGLSKSNNDSESSDYQKKKSVKSRHVKFSPSTLQREIDNNLTKLSSTEPYYNFLMAHNIKGKKLKNMNLENEALYDIVGHPSKSAFKHWCKLTVEERQPYCDMANKARLRQNNNFSNKRNMDSKDCRERLSVIRNVWLNGVKVNSEAQNYDKDRRMELKVLDHNITNAVTNAHFYGNDLGVHVLYKRGF